MMPRCSDKNHHQDAQLENGQQTASFNVDRGSRWLLTAFVLLGLLPWSSTARRTRRYDMPSRECGDELRRITGAAILSNTHNIEPSSSPCMLKFSADDEKHSSKQIRIITEKLNITDCNTSLLLFYNTEPSNKPDFTFDCHSGSAPPLITPGQVLTLSLRQPTEKGFEFRIILTAFKIVTKQKSGRCDELICGKAVDGECIHEDLKCDGFKNCEDGSDEFECPTHNYSGGSGMLKSQLFRWGMKGFIGMVLGAVTFVVLMIVTGVACCHVRGMTGSTVRGGYIQASGGSGKNNTNSNTTEMLARIPCLKFLGYANPQTETGYSPQHGTGNSEPGTVGYQAGEEKVNMNTPH